MIRNSTEVSYDVGIDEAGRGPVLGPMIYGAAIWPTGTEKKPMITEHNINDSKALTFEQRSSQLRHLETLKVK
jgi:ribonuclease H2 subunit A